MLRIFHRLLCLILATVLQDRYCLHVPSQSLWLDSRSLLLPSSLPDTLLDPFTNTPFFFFCCVWHLVIPSFQLFFSESVWLGSYTKLWACKFLTVLLCFRIISRQALFLDCYLLSDVDLVSNINRGGDELQCTRISIGEFRYQALMIHYCFWHQIRSDQSFSCVRLFATPWIAMKQKMQCTWSQKTWSLTFVL